VPQSRLHIGMDMRFWQLPFLLAWSSVHAIQDSTASCLLCQAVVAELTSFASNSSRVSRAVASLQHDCDKIFPQPNSTMRQGCESLAKNAVELLPFIHKEIGTLAWDVRAVCAALGACEVPCCESDAPEQVHLSLRAKPSEMAVMWTTTSATAGQSVFWGPSAAGLPQTIAEKNPPKTYRDFGWRGSLHTAVMYNLAPNTTYFYQVGSDVDGAGGRSAVFSFRTLPTGAGGQDPLRVVSLGDMGYGPLSDATVARLTALVTAGKVDMVLHNGDIGYADGDMHHWDVFMRKIEPIAARVPYMTSPGNHGEISRPPSLPPAPLALPPARYMAYPRITLSARATYGIPAHTPLRTRAPTVKLCSSYPSCPPSPASQSSGSISPHIRRGSPCLTMVRTTECTGPSTWRAATCI
jgi:hypothetical protein